MRVYSDTASRALDSVALHSAILSVLETRLRSSRSGSVPGHNFAASRDDPHEKSGLTASGRREPIVRPAVDLEVTSSCRGARWGETPSSLPNRLRHNERVSPAPSQPDLFPDELGPVDPFGTPGGSARRDS